MRAQLIAYVSERLGRGSGIVVPNEIAIHAVDTVEQFMRQDPELEAAKLMSARSIVFIQKSAAQAYVAAFSELLRAGIEAVADKQLLTTQGPTYKGVRVTQAQWEAFAKMEGLERG